MPSTKTETAGLCSGLANAEMKIALGNVTTYCQPIKDQLKEKAKWAQAIIKRAKEKAKAKVKEKPKEREKVEKEAKGRKEKEKGKRPESVITVISRVTLLQIVGIMRIQTITKHADPV